MSARLVKLIPTGEMVHTPVGLIECVEPVEVKPLPEDEIVDLWRQTKEVISFARALESKHGITEKKDEFHYRN